MTVEIQLQLEILRGEKASYPPHTQCRWPVSLCPDRSRVDSGQERRYPVGRSGLAGRERLWEQSERGDTSSLSTKHSTANTTTVSFKGFTLCLHAPTLRTRSSGGRETRLPAVGTSRAGLTPGEGGHTRKWGESSSRTQLRLC